MAIWILAWFGLGIILLNLFCFNFGRLRSPFFMEKKKMADVYCGSIDKNWVDASTLVTFGDGDYLIQNRGAKMLLAHVGSSAPADSDLDGVVIPYLMQAHYKASDGSLYLKSPDGSCLINISEAATE